MDYIDWVIAKAIALCVAAFVWGIYTELTGRELNGQPKQPGRHEE